MGQTEHVIGVLDQVSKLLDEKIGNRPQAKILVDNLMASLHRDAQREKQEYKIPQLNAQEYPVAQQEIILKINEIIKMLNDHTVRR